MSVDLHVFLDPSKMVTPFDWAKAVQASGFDVEMDSAFDPSTFSGFLPCKYKGKDAGFEYSHQMLTGPEQNDFGIGDTSRPACVTFSTRSNCREFASSMICSAVLASIVDGVLRDADGETQISSSDAVAWAKSGEEGIQGDIEQQDLEASGTPPPQQASAALPARPTKPWWKLW